MTKNQQELKIAFTKNYDGEICQETWYVNKGDFSIPNIPFETILEYKGYIRGKSALNIEWLDTKNNRLLYSSMNILDRAIKNHFLKDGHIEGTFCFYKQGTSILLTMEGI